MIFGRAITSDSRDQRLLAALLDSWDRSNAILLNLLRALPEGGLEAKAMEGSAPERCLKKRVVERDPDRIARLLNDSAMTVRDG